MSEHTKGPWEAVETGSGMLRRCFIKEPTGNVVATCSLLNDDARMIAAAPEMLSLLEFLKEVLEEDEQGGNRPCEWNHENGSPLEWVTWCLAQATGEEAQS